MAVENEGWTEATCVLASAWEECRSKALHKAACEEFGIVSSRNYGVLGVEGQRSHQLLRQRSVYNFSKGQRGTHCHGHCRNSWPS
jgi:hypothetical protein